MKQTKITKSARGESCQIRIPGICNFDPATTVLCHWNGSGMATKHNDVKAAYGCSQCHLVVDFDIHAKKHDFSRQEIRQFHFEAILRTLDKFIEKGLLIEAYIESNLSLTDK